MELRLEPPPPELPPELPLSALEFPPGLPLELRDPSNEMIDRWRSETIQIARGDQGAKVRPRCWFRSCRRFQRAGGSDRAGGSERRVVLIVPAVRARGWF